LDVQQERTTWEYVGPQSDLPFPDMDSLCLPADLDLAERTVLEAEVLMWRLWTASKAAT
jgi:hypothetical protein